MLNKIGAIAHWIAHTNDKAMPKISEMERDFLMASFFTLLRTGIIGPYPYIYKKVAEF